MSFQLVSPEPSEGVKRAVKLMDDCVSRILRENHYYLCKRDKEMNKELPPGVVVSSQEGGVG